MSATARLISSHPSICKAALYCTGSYIAEMNRFQRHQWSKTCTIRIGSYI